MKGKTAKNILVSILVIALLLGCKDAFHDKDDSAPVIPDGKSYTVSFDANKGSGTAPSPIPAKSGESIRLPNAGDLSRTKYTFGCWNTNASGTGTNYSAGEEFTVPTRDVTLYAKWEAAGSSAVSVTGVSLDKPSLSLKVDEVYTLTATVSPSNATNKSVNWASSNPSVATVSTSGTVTAKSAGSAKITVSTVDGNETDSCTVAVSSGGIDSISGLANKLAWLESNAQSGGNYTIEVSANESIGPQMIYYSGKNNITITLKGIGSNRTISLSSNGSMFKVRSDVYSGLTLVLDNNITLQGRNNNTSSLIMVYAGGMLKMNSGSTVMGNNSESDGSMNVGNGGIFIMNGGTISGNSAKDGGGVYVYYNGTFTMNNGNISGNSADRGGGVHVVDGGTFTMNGGTIDGNTAKTRGGGVYYRGNFNNNYPSGIYGNTPDNISDY